MNRLAIRLRRLERAREEQAAQRPPVREIILHVPAEDADTPAAAMAAAMPYTLWTAPGVEASYPRWVDPYDARQDIT